MALISTTTYIDLEGRLDAPFYKSEYVELENTLNKIEKSKKFKILPLGSISNKINKGIFYILKNEYRSEGIPFIRVADIKPIFLEPSNMQFISKEKNDLEKITSLKPGDLVISKSGTVGRVSLLFDDYPTYNISQDVIGISIKKSRILPEYLVAFLNTKFGQFQLQRGKSIVVQAHLELGAIRNLRIIIPDNKKQRQIANKIKKIRSLKNKTEELYREALTTLDKLLKLKKSENDSMHFSIPYREISNSIGWSVEQHLPKYAEILESLENSSFPIKNVSQLVEISHEKLDPRNFPEKIFNYIPFSNISASFGFIESSNKFKGHEAKKRARNFLRTNDILIPNLEGSFNKVGIVTKEFNESIGTTGFFVLRTKRMNPWFAFALFRSEIGQLQLPQKISGTILQSISEDVLKEIKLPLIPKKSQDLIGNLMLQSYNTYIQYHKLKKNCLTDLENYLRI